MATTSRFSFGTKIIEVKDNRMHGEGVLLTVSKERWDEDRQQFSIPASIAKALGVILTGEKDD